MTKAPDTAVARLLRGDPPATWLEYDWMLALFDSGLVGVEPEGPHADEPRRRGHPESQRVEWVSWFAEHFPVDSRRGREIVAALAYLEQPARRCAVAGCDEPARGRSRACTESHARALRRKPAGTAKGPGSDRNGVALAPTPETRTSDPHLPGETRPIIADTADTSDLPTRRCSNCGADITSKRRGAVVCSDVCRKRIARRARTMAAGAELSDLLGQPQLFETGRS